MSRFFTASPKKRGGEFETHLSLYFKNHNSKGNDEKAQKPCDFKLKNAHDWNGNGFKAVNS